MLWSGFYFQMIVLLTTIYIIYIYYQDTKKNPLNLPKSVYFNKCIKLYCVPLHLKIKQELMDF